MILIKLGGSLLSWPDFPRRLRAFLDFQRVERLVLVVGGGGAADWVREMDRVHQLTAEQSHALAIRSLELTSHLVSTLVPGLQVITTIVEIETVWREKRIPVLAPRLVLDEDDRELHDPLPRSWAVTSDSIAARLAVRLGADELILLKSISVAPNIDIVESSRLGLVDSLFPEIAKPLKRVSFVNLKEF